MYKLNRLVRKPTICIGENKDAEADQRLCVRYTDSTLPLLFKYEIFQASSLILLLHRPVCVGPVRKPHCWFSHETAIIFSGALKTSGSIIVWPAYPSKSYYATIRVGNTQSCGRTTTCTMTFTVTFTNFVSCYLYIKMFWLIFCYPLA